MNAWLLSVIALVIIGGLIASAETALTRISRVRAEEYAREDRRGAARLQAIVTDPPRYLNLLLLLRLSCELVATVIATLLFIDLLDDQGWAYFWAAVVMIVISYVVVGVMPRTLGRQHAEPVALASAPIVYGLTRIFGPLPKLLILLGNALTPGKGFRDGPFTSEAELRDLVDLAEERRVIEPDEREMIHSVFELGDTLVREVMVPRTDMVYIERGKTISQALSLALRSGFSRIPVVGENEDDVIGIAYLKDIARKIHESGEGGGKEQVESIMRPAAYVPESKPIDQLMREMQARQIHIAIVIDEYGGTMRPGHDRGRPGGDRRGDHRRVRPGGAAGGDHAGRRVARDGPDAGGRAGRAVRHRDRGGRRGDRGRAAGPRARPGPDRRVARGGGRAVAHGREPGRAAQPDQHGGGAAGHAP